MHLKDLEDVRQASTRVVRHHYHRTQTRRSRWHRSSAAVTICNTRRWPIRYADFVTIGNAEDVIVGDVIVVVTSFFGQQMALLLLDFDVDLVVELGVMDQTPSS